MNHKKLVADLATSADITNKLADKVIECLAEVMTNELVKSGKVKLPGIGIFGIRQMKPRKARNPKTGEGVDVPARNRPTFKAAKELKARMVG